MCQRLFLFASIISSFSMGFYFHGVLVSRIRMELCGFCCLWLTGSWSTPSPWPWCASSCWFWVGIVALHSQTIPLHHLHVQPVLTFLENVRFYCQLLAALINSGFKSQLMWLPLPLCFLLTLNYLLFQ